MKKNWALIVIAIAIIGTGAVFYARHKSPAASDVPITAVPITDSSSTPTSDQFVNNLSFKAGDTIASPLTITGEAVNTWYFEGSFPIKVRDEYGVVVATVPAQAQSDWTAAGFVPFKATVSFTAPTTTVGFISLEKDNPSGDPARDQAVIVPVRFK